MALALPPELCHISKANGIAQKGGRTEHTGRKGRHAREHPRAPAEEAAWAGSQQRRRGHGRPTHSSQGLPWPLLPSTLSPRRPGASGVSRAQMERRQNEQASLCRSSNGGTVAAETQGGGAHGGSQGSWRPLTQRALKPLGWVAAALRSWGSDPCQAYLPTCYREVSGWTREPRSQGRGRRALQFRSRSR